MLTQDAVEELKSKLESITQYAETELIARPEWGAIKFDEARPDIDLSLSIAKDLSEMPLEYLTEAAQQQLVGHIPEVALGLEAIDGFSLERGGEPARVREQLCAELHGQAEQFSALAGPVIPYLAYRRGDIAASMAELDRALAAGKRLYSDAKDRVAHEENEVKAIVKAAREASASVGVATFTQEFDNEAGDLKDRSRSWLWAAAGFGGATIVAAIGSFFWPVVTDQAGAWETLRIAISKVTVIAVLFTSTVWCGRIYRALVHQATVNKHRALSLKTFQAFVEATADPYVRDAVLMAATKAVFGAVPTGLVEQAMSEEPAVNFVEIGKSSAKALDKSVSD